MKKKLFSCLIFFIIFLIGCSSADIKTSITRMKLKNDTKYLKKKLISKHKNLYHSLNELEYSEDMEKLYSSIDKDKEETTLFKTMELISKVKDNHTTFIPDELLFSKVYPIKLYWFEDGLYVLEAAHNYKKIIGNKLLYINGYPVDEIYAYTKQIISYENESWAKLISPKYIVSGEFLKYYKFIDEIEEVEFTFSIYDKDENVLIKPIDKAEDVDKNYMTYNEFLKVDKPISLLNIDDKNFFYEYFESKQTLYFQLNRCFDEKSEKFKDFTKRIFKTIKKKDVEKLIIDLRFNSDGDKKYFKKYFIPKLKKSKLNRKGRVIVLVGRRTLSSSMFILKELEKLEIIKSYGEPTGSNFNHYGEIGILVLPKTKLKISYPKKYFNLTENYDFNYIPDVREFEYSESYFQGKDNLFEKIIFD